jgi:hypothetical protein
MKSGRADGEGLDPGALRITRIKMTTTGRKNGSMDFINPKAPRLLGIYPSSLQAHFLVLDCMNN